MLGIDIIDLNDPLLNERSKRSLELIQSDDDKIIDHAHLFWLLWSAKEAVFKCRREPINFAPKTIPIELKQIDEDISFESNDLKGKIIQNEHSILAICSDTIEEVSFKIYNEENKNWTEQIRKLIVQFFHEQGKEIEIGSDELNLPTILPTNTPISVSHHGKMGAFAYPNSLLNR